MEIDYIRIYEDIIKHYPLGISPEDPLFNQYKGSALFEELSYSKLKPRAYNKWKSLVNELKNGSSDVLESDYESPLFYPCYTGILVLHNEKNSKVVYRRELVFHLSLLSPYFTIYGLDKVNVNSGTEMMKEFEPLLYLSPIDIYEPYFKLVRTQIEKMYLDYKYISHGILTKRVNALYVPGSKIKNGQYSSVFQALFIPEDVTNYKSFGDMWYE